MDLNIGRYRILEEIASGSQGAVYRGFDPQEGRIVALKVLHPSLTTDPAYLERFHREAQIAVSINHSNVVKVFEVGESAGRHFIAMEFLPESLGRILDTGDVLPVGRAVQFAAQIADGLAAAHDLGIVHRDVKPQNVLIGPNGEAKVTDFGIARAAALSNMTATGIIMGTPYYMSPEQANGQPTDARSDLYSLGCVLYQMLTGELPFEGTTPLVVLRKHVEETPRPVRSLRSDVPPAVAGAVERAMAKDPFQRFQNMNELVAALGGTSPGPEGAMRGAAVAAPLQGQATIISPPVATAAPASLPVDLPKIRPWFFLRKVNRFVLIGTLASVMAIQFGLLAYINGWLPIQKDGSQPSTRDGENITPRAPESLGTSQPTEADIAAPAPSARPGDEVVPEKAVADDGQGTNSPEPDTQLLAPADLTPLPGFLLTVTSTGNSSDALRGDGICATSEGDCTFFAAIQEANSREDVDTIAFDIPESDPGFDPATGVFSIRPPLDGLPNVKTPVIIDGYTQPGANANTNPMTQGSNAVLKIELDGSDVGPGVPGLVIKSGGSTIRGLIINRFTGDGIRLKNTHGGNLLLGNFIGTNPNGTAALGNGVDGVSIEGPNNTIGGTAPESRNVISGNLRNGFHIISTGSKVATKNVLLGNFIGTDVTGSAPLGNGSNGVSLNGSSDNFIGGTETGAGNVISGNEANGIRISKGATGNAVQGNFIGTDVTGMVGLGNYSDGVAIDGVSGNVIGGNIPEARNIISGNGRNGVRLSLPGAKGNRIQGNYIGTGIKGVTALGNGRHGVAITRAVGNVVGGPDIEQRNVISGNIGNGISITDRATENLIQGNIIGADVTGITNLGNGAYGIFVRNAAENSIGGEQEGVENLITFNTKGGIVVDSSRGN